MTDLCELFQKVQDVYAVWMVPDEFLGWVLLSETLAEMYEAGQVLMVCLSLFVGLQW